MKWLDRMADSYGAWLVACFGLLLILLTWAGVFDWVDPALVVSCPPGSMETIGYIDGDTVKLCSILR